MTTILVCTIGGHLAQLHALVPRLEGVDPDDVLWITHESAQSTSLLRDEAVEYVPYIDERDIRGVARAVVPALRRLRATGAELVVSTGSAIAGAWLPAAVALRREAVFIESAAITEGHTRTGRLLQAVPGVRLVTQSSATADGRWAFHGSVFDGFRASRHPTGRELERVVVTVGTSREFGFRSLIEGLVPLLRDVPEVVWQTGHTDLEGLDIDARPWLPAAELAEAMREADVVVSHAGGGSALAALVAGRRPVLVPRRVARHEFRDDHQVLLARQLHAAGVAEHVELDELTLDRLVGAQGWVVEPASASSPIPVRGRP